MLEERIDLIAILKVILSILLVILVVYRIILGINIEQKNRISSRKMVTSIEDNIKDDAVWCGAFNLIWNDFKNDIVKKDIVFKKQTQTVKNLNKGTFNSAYISNNSFYKIAGIQTFELKEKIEKDLRERFNETSNILEGFNWSDKKNNDYFLYSMIKKKFEYEKPFNTFKNEKFKSQENVKFFGIGKNSNDELRKQVGVLYYNSNKDFAVKLLTTTEDEIIFATNINKNSFKDIYDEVVNKEKKYKGEKSFTKDDLLKVPKIKLRAKEEFKELENQVFTFKNNKKYQITKAIQLVDFNINEKGGKVLSEAGIESKKMTSSNNKKRTFYINDTFLIFLKEKNEPLPYFAARISDISKYQ